MKPEYDFVALGGGTAGLVATRTVAEMGGRAALIEKDRPGGDCLYTGCIPSKTILASAWLAQRMRNADVVALDPVDPKPDFERVMNRIETVIEAAGTEDDPDYLESLGVEVVKAHGRFVGPGRIEADGRELRWRTALIATGSSPVLPPIPGLEAVEPLTSESVFDLRDRPERLVVLGGGPIGVELGQAFARLGSNVQIIEALPRLLPREDPEASGLLESTLIAEGIGVRTGARVTRVEADSGGAGRLILEARRGADAGAQEEIRNGQRPERQDVTGGSGAAGGIDDAIPFDRILVATGQAPVTDDLGLDSVGVELSEGGAVRVNDYLRTTGSHIYAGGDVVGQLLFTHVAAYHGLIAVANGLFRARQKAGREWIPWVTFTDPKIARAGLTEDEARQRLGKDPVVLRYDHARLDRALTVGRGVGFSKLIADPRGRLLGATIVGTAAGESISEIGRLIRDKRKVKDLSQTICAYPTFHMGATIAASHWWRHKLFTPKGRRRFARALSILRRIDRPRGR